MGQKKIETLLVEIKSPTEIKFEDLLLSKDFDGKKQRIQGKGVSIRILDIDNTKNTIVGIVETSRKTNVPAKKDEINDTISDIGLQSHESLVYPNIFIYDVKRKLIMYESNKNGCFIDHFILFFYRCAKSENCEFKDFGLTFLPLLNKDEYIRLQRFDYIRSVEMKVANPSEIELSENEANSSLGQVISAGSTMGSTNVTTKFNITSRDKNEGLLRKSVDDILQKARTILLSDKHHNIQKLIVSGYDLDGENPNKLEPIDLITDRYLKTIELNEPRVNTDLLETPRTFAIKSLHTSCCQDFDEIIGIK